MSFGERILVSTHTYKRVAFFK